MLQTVQAEVEVNGTVRLLEPLQLTKTTRAVVTLLEESTMPVDESGNATALLELLRSPAFANRQSYPAEEIEEQIEENQNAWASMLGKRELS
jgi:DTW domain-containing protein YfiP